MGGSSSKELTEVQLTEVQKLLQQSTAIDIRNLYDKDSDFVKKKLKQFSEIKGKNDKDKKLTPDQRQRKREAKRILKKLEELEQNFDFPPVEESKGPNTMAAGYQNMKF